MSNTSATGGYLSQTETALPGGLTLLQYLQQVIVGLTGLTGTLVRPKWQVNPPKVLPDPLDNYCTFGISITDHDANAYLETAQNGNSSTMQRHEEITMVCSFYGGNSYSNAAKLRDAFQIAQNRDALKAANIGFKETTPIMYVPELHGQVWFPRHDMTVVLRRQINKTFAVLEFDSAAGTIKALKDNNQIENVPWNVSEIP